MTSPQELHVQIAADLRQRLSAGTIAAGEPVLITVLAQQWRAARPTVAKALRALERDGLLRRYPGVGYRVLPGSKPTPPHPSQGDGAPVPERPALSRHQQVVAQAVVKILEPLLKDMGRRLDEMSEKTDTLLAELAATAARVEQAIPQSDTGALN